MKTEFKVVSNRYLEGMLDELNAHGDEGWVIGAYVQEFGVTKVILQREITTNIFGKRKT